MPRGKRNPTPVPTKPTKPRGRAATAAKTGRRSKTSPIQNEALAAAEAKLVKKYPDRRIKAGSLLPAGALAEFGKKRTVIIECSECGADRRIATSDIFHTSLCLKCKRASKKKAAAE